MRVGGGRIMRSLGILDRRDDAWMAGWCREGLNGCVQRALEHFPEVTKMMVGIGLEGC